MKYRFEECSWDAGGKCPRLKMYRYGKKKIPLRFLRELLNNMRERELNVVQTKLDVAITAVLNKQSLDTISILDQN